jgi:TonB family protein
MTYRSSKDARETPSREAKVPSSRARIACWIGVLALLFVLCAPGLGADPFREWNRKFQDAIGLLKSGEPEKALRKLEGVLEEYAGLAGPGAANERNLGTILVHRAIAEQALGRAEDARWSWDLAVNFLPMAHTFDLSPFGEAGQELLEYARIAAREKESKPFPDARGCENCVPGLTPPKPIKTVQPRYTTAGWQFLVEGALVVRVVVDAQGRVRSPEVIEKLSTPGLSYAALIALRGWKFEPATLDGKPIPVYYTLTVNYKLRK